MTLKRYIFPLNSIPSYFNGGLRFVVFLIVEGNINIFCGITKRYVLIISLFSIKKLFEQDVIFVNDLLFELDTTNSFTIVSNKISKINYLIWEGLRHSVPKHLKNSNCLRSEISLILTIDNKEFDILEKKSKDYYMLIKRIIAQCPKNSKHLCQDFNLTQDQLKKVFLLPHEVAFEPYLKAFQYKVLNSILFTNKKLCKIGYTQDDKCSLCKTDSESLFNTTSFVDTPSSFGRNFNITITHWQENSSVWPYKTLLQEYYIQIALYWIIWYWSLNYTYGVVGEIRLF